MTDNVDWPKLALEYQQKFRRNRVRESSRSYQYQKLGEPRFPDNLVLRDYQRQAVVNWLQNKGRGTLKMATGSGKTIIALAITQCLASRDRN